MELLNGVTSDATREQSGIKGAPIAASPAPASAVEIESFIHEYYEAWGGTDLDRIMSYYSEDVVLQIPGLLMEGKNAVRDQFAVPFTTAFPGNRHIVKGMIFGPGVVNVEFIFEAQHKGPFAGHAATGARIKLPGCGVYQYDPTKWQITAGRIYFDVGTLLQTITDSLLGDRKKAEEALRTNERNLSLITNVVPTFIHVLRSDGSVLYVNQAVLGYTGLTLEDVRKEDYRARVFHPEDVERLREESLEALTRPVPFENEQRVLGKDGKYRWFLIRYNPLLDAQGRIDRWYVAAFDIEDRKQTEWLRAAEMRTLQMIADGAGLTDILNHVCTSIDAQISPRFTTILLMDPDGKKLWPASSPKVPEEWVRAITPLPVAADTGLCGNAAFVKARVVVPDVAIESIWREEYRALALKNGIRAGWSQPILTKENEVLGTFAVYSAESGVPTTEDLALMEASARLALIAIERQRSQEARKKAEEARQASERNLAAIVNTIPTAAWTTRPDGYCDFLNQVWLNYAGMTAEKAEGWGWAEAIHPDDREKLVEEWQSCLTSGTPVDTEARIRRFDSSYRWFLIRGNPLRDESGKILKWYGTCVDIEDRKRGEEALRARELSWRQIVDNIPGLVATTGALGEVEFLNQQTLEYFGKTNEELKDWALIGAVHPDDLPRVIDARKKSIEAGQIYEIEHRCRRADGIYRWFQVRGLPVRDEEGRITAWYLLLTDIEDRKRAEEAQARQANVRADVSAAFSKPTHLREILRGCTEAIVRHLDAAFARIWMLNKDESMLELRASAGLYTRLDGSYSRIPIGDLKVGLIAREKKAQFTNNVMNDPRVNDKRWAKSNGMVAFAGHPLVVEDRLIGVVALFARSALSESILNTLASVADTIAQGIERKRAEEEIQVLKDQLYKENIALREEIDKTSMFEEIVGTSPPLKDVLTRVSKVAPTDSTVLITGETGTGKELIARAIHKRSGRASRVFVSVNCAGIPPALVASELFGHEKGAFTGALQRRIGRFELAEGGTIFLDEIGELPAETQIALLRVLQEREFERVGGGRPLRTDIRLIAATNRDLKAAIAGGSFRSDLFYRLNVFPIEMPSLRARRQDIPLLAEYFIHRYGGKMGKRISRISNESLQMLQSYTWPGNIRELQNVIERSVIICESEALTVDESWFAGQTLESSSSTQPLAQKLAADEKTTIEAALAEARGRVSGPSGAAVKLGLPASTLESKIRALKINKHLFKATGQE
jgi:PAS domain S-box-containing protein